MTKSTNDGRAEVAAAPPLDGCALFRKTLANEQAHLRNLEDRADEVSLQISRLEDAEHPDTEQIARLKAALDRINEDIERTRGNIESIQIDITMFC
jgi:TolA-binding protein